MFFVIYSNIFQNAAFGVDGKLFPLGSKPRFKKKPSDEEPKAQHFWNYKRGYCLNAMIVGDGKYFRWCIQMLIYDCTRGVYFSKSCNLFPNPIFNFFPQFILKKLTIFTYKIFLSSYIFSCIKYSPLGHKRGREILFLLELLVQRLHKRVQMFFFLYKFYV